MNILHSILCTIAYMYCVGFVLAFAFHWIGVLSIDEHYDFVLEYGLILGCFFLVGLGLARALLSWFFVVPIIRIGYEAVTEKDLRV